MNWERHYNTFNMTADEAFSHFLLDGDKVFFAGGINSGYLLKELLKRIEKGILRDICVIGNNCHYDVDFANKKLKENGFRYEAFFYGPSERAGMRNETVHYIPIHLSRLAQYLKTVSKPNVVLLMVSEPDENGYCSLGPHSGNFALDIDAARVVIAQVNHNIPKVYGNPNLVKVHVERIDAFVSYDEALPEFLIPEATKIETLIGYHIAHYINDGDCIQLGIGGLSSALGRMLKDFRHLGIHSEMLSSSMIDLIKIGVVDNSKKNIHRGKSIVGFCMGEQKDYEYLSCNPNIYFDSYDYVIDPRIIAQNDNMVSINTAMQVNLYGEIFSDAIGNRQYSGCGGQVDFIRGSNMAKNGRSFIAIPSTLHTPSGEKSRIVMPSQNSWPVTVSRFDTRFVVTEYGAVDLFGKSVSERANLLISIANPKYREDLYLDAREKGIIY